MSQEAEVKSELTRITNGALHEDKNGSITLRGVIPSTSLCALKIDNYQREQLPMQTVSKLAEALKAGAKIPDITLGARTGDFVERAGTFTIKGDVYVALSKLFRAGKITKFYPGIYGIEDTPEESNTSAGVDLQPLTGVK